VDGRVIVAVEPVEHVGIGAVLQVPVDGGLYDHGGPRPARPYIGLSLASTVLGAGSEIIHEAGCKPRASLRLFFTRQI